MSISTGWFGIPGGRPGGKVHVALDGKPRCGTRVSPRAEYQWCSGGVNWEYLECKRCKSQVRRDHEAVGRRMAT